MPCFEAVLTIWTTSSVERGYSTAPGKPVGPCAAGNGIVSLVPSLEVKGSAPHSL